MSKDKSKEIVIMDKYVKKEKIGEGGFGACFIYKRKKDDKIFVCKEVREGKEKIDNKSDFEEEARVQKLMNHDNIVIVEDFFKYEEKDHLVTEFCLNGDMSKLLKRRKRLTELEIQYYIFQLIQALKYIHGKGFIHRDLKLGNILLTHKMKLKVGDFGLAIKYDSSDKNRCGTPNYMAPEIVNKKSYSYEVDIWAVGIIIYMMIYGKSPFEGYEQEETYKRIRNDKLHFPKEPKASEDVKDLIKKILVKEPSDRLNLDQILEHDFFKQGKIPESLPTYTNFCQPSLDYIKKYIPNVGDDGIVIKKGSKLTKRQDTNTKSENPSTGTTNNNFDLSIKQFDYIKGNDNIVYTLSNNLLGYYSNKGYNMILNPTTNAITYIKIGDEENEDLFQEGVPQECISDERILNHYKDYIESNINRNNILISSNKEKSQNEKDGNRNPIYIKRMLNTIKGTLFRFSNDDIQYYFNDKTQMFIDKNKNVAYINKKGDKKIYSLSSSGFIGEEETKEKFKNIKECVDTMLRLAK